MLSALLTLLLAAPPPDGGSVVWRFPHPGSDALQAAVVAARGDDPTHRVTNAEIDETLSADATVGGCLDDSRICANPAVDALALFGVRARVDATSAQTNGEYVLTLVATPTATGDARTITTRGQTLEAAVSAGLAELRGETSIRVAVTPEDATVWIDGTQVGQGSGHYPAAPGNHAVRVEAARYTPLEQSAEVKVGSTPVLTFVMASADGELVLSIKPPTAIVTIDGAPVEDWSKPLLLPPKTYRVGITAKGHVPHEQDMVVKLATRHDLKVTLPEEQKGLLELLKTPHPDTLARNGYVRADIRIGSVFDGPVNVATTRNQQRIAIDELDESVGVLGVNLGVGWRHRYWFVEPLGMSIDSGGDTDSITLSERVDGEIEGLTRVNLKPAWVGARYPAWRLDPYIQAGFLVVFESFDLKLPDETREVSNRLLQFGVEFGVRYALDPDWFLNLSGGFEFWPDERSSGSLMLGAGWALDLPEWL